MRVSRMNELCECCKHPNCLQVTWSALFERWLCAECLAVCTMVNLGEFVSARRHWLMHDVQYEDLYGVSNGPQEAL